MDYKFILIILTHINYEYDILEGPESYDDNHRFKEEGSRK